MKKKITFYTIAIVIIIIGIILVAVLGNIKKNRKIDKQGEIAGITYNILEELPKANYDYSKRGYYVDTYNRPDSPYYYTITMGERATGGYSIEIIDVQIDKERNLEITVKETSPKDSDIVTQAYTYPACCIEISTHVNTVTIKNTNGYEFMILN